MDMYWPVFIAGILVTVAGLAVLRHHQDSSSGVAEKHRTPFSRIGKKITAHSPGPLRKIGSGIGGILFGVLGMVLAYIIANDYWER